MTFQQAAPGAGQPQPRTAAVRAEPKALAVYGGTAWVEEILATEKRVESIAVARARHGGDVAIEVRVRFFNRVHPVKVGDAVVYECQLVSEPLPDSVAPCRCRSRGHDHG